MCVRELTDSLRAPRWSRRLQKLSAQAQAGQRVRRPHARGHGRR